MLCVSAMNLLFIPYTHLRPDLIDHIESSRGIDSRAARLYSRAMQSRLEEIVAELKADSGSIHLIEDGVLVLKAHFGIPPQVIEIVSRVPIGKGMAGLAAERNEPVSSCNIQSDETGNVKAGARQTGVGGAIVVPVRNLQGEAIGALGIGVRSEYSYTEEETARLLEMAGNLGQRNQ